MENTHLNTTSGATAISCSVSSSSLCPRSSSVASPLKAWTHETLEKFSNEMNDHPGGGTGGGHSSNHQNKNERFQDHFLLSPSENDDVSTKVLPAYHHHPDASFSPIQLQPELYPTEEQEQEEAIYTSTIEAQVQREFDALSRTEQQEVNSDVQGTNPIMIAGGASEPRRLEEIELESLDREFRKLVLPTTSEYHLLAPALDHDFVRDPQLRRKMLRAEHYDCSKAALRLAKFLTLVQQVFGPNLLMRPIQLADLSPQERQLQRQGLQQLFKFRDHAGRRIAACFDSPFPRIATFESQVSEETEEYESTGANHKSNKIMSLFCCSRSS
jgi:hypothetical protein